MSVSAPKCKMCGTAHWSTQRCPALGDAPKPTVENLREVVAKVAPKPAAPKKPREASPAKSTLVLGENGMLDVGLILAELADWKARALDAEAYREATRAKKRESVAKCREKAKSDSGKSGKKGARI